VPRTVWLAGSAMPRLKFNALAMTCCSRCGNTSANRLQPGPSSGGATLQLPAGILQFGFTKVEISPDGNEPIELS
jgi:hypothetical protein